MSESSELNEADVIYDWNIRGDICTPPLRRVLFVDETLRDGIQSPSVTDACIEDKMEIVRLLDRVGVNFVEDPVLTDPWREEVLSDRDAFVHLWASVELAANARWLFTTEGSKMGALVEAVREPSEREPATRVVAREAASER